MAREARAATLYSVGPVEGPDHEATIRFGGKAPGRRAHSSDGIRAMGGIVSPPPRIVPGGLSQSRDELTELSIGLSQAVQAADRSTTPFGTVPVVTMRHSSIRSFRASATIMVVLRAPFAPSVRAWYHCTSALSFWNKRNLQAS